MHDQHADISGSQFEIIIKCSHQKTLAEKYKHINPNK